MRNQPSDSHVFWMIVLCLLPILFIAFVLAGGIAVSPWFFLMIFLLCLLGMYSMMARPVSVEPEDDEEFPSGSPVERVPEDVLRRTVDVIHPLADYRVKDVFVIEGRLLVEPEVALAMLQKSFSDTPLVPLLRESAAGRPSLVIAPGETVTTSVRNTNRSWINLALFLATFGTTTWAGAAHQGINLLAEPGRFAEGLPYAAALMFILAAHELGHYFTARRYEMKVTLPYFIPVPFMLGTFGAFIQMKSLAPNRTAMFDVAIMGPLAGLVIALPALLIGLKYSTLAADTGAPSIFMGGADAGSSLLFAFLAKIALGETVLQGHLLILHPVAFAGWLGLFVTALNLIPIGQLDGGHLAHTLLGQRTAHTVSVVSITALVVLGLVVWSGLLFWALLIFFLAGTRDVPPLNDVTRLNRGRLVLGAAALILLLLIIIPVPDALYSSFGLHSPYS